MRVALSWMLLMTREIKRSKRVTELWWELEVSVEMREAELDVHMDQKRAAHAKTWKS